MVRSRSMTTAVVLTALLGVVGIVDAIRILSAGSAGLPPMEGLETRGGPPFAAGVLFMALGVASLFGAFGLWKNQRWGKVVAVTTAAIFGLFSLGDVLGATMGARFDLALISALIVAACIAIIVLVLRRQPPPLAA